MYSVVQAIGVYCVAVKYSAGQWCIVWLKVLLLVYSVITYKSTFITSTKKASTAGTATERVQRSHTGHTAMTVKTAINYDRFTGEAHRRPLIYGG